ncbi:MAG: glycosyltransferase family 9 protein [Capsulimonadaceae bacterium]|nr:glycosyltransferase family 9 protein [Capsulimonadaceae bacterium]
MRVGANGDIAMGTPVLSALRSAYPDAHITWVVEPGGSQMIDAHPDVDDILIWHGSFWKLLTRNGIFPALIYYMFKVRRQLLARKYDIFISFQPEEWPLFAKAVAAPESIGVFDTFWQYSGATSTSKNVALYRHAFTRADLPAHRADQYRLALRALGLSSDCPSAMSLGYTSEDRDAVGRYLAKAGIAGAARIALIAPKTGWPSKCWPLERYAELSDRLVAAGLNVVLIGGVKDSDALTRVAGAMSKPPLIAAGTLSLREMMALVHRAELVVSGDTGPMHIAAAFGTPFVALFGPTSPDAYAPRSTSGVVIAKTVPCGPCERKVCPMTGEGFEKCMRLITVDEVHLACVKMISAQRELKEP